MTATPILHAGRSLYPLRNNRELTRAELHTLLAMAGFHNIEVAFLRARRCRTELARLKGIGSALRDAWPSVRKSSIAFAEK